MKTNLYGLILALFAVVVFTGCDKDDDIRVSDVPQNVMNAFEAKFPNVVGVEWEKKSDYYVADFWKEGMETHVWIAQGLFCQVAALLFRILRANTQQDQKALANTAHNFTFNGDRCGFYSC